MDGSALQFRRVTPTAIVPAPSPFGVGYDIRADLPGKIVRIGMIHETIPTGLEVVPPTGFYAKLIMPPWLASAHGLDIIGGIISPKGGAVMVTMVTHCESVTIHHADRIALLVLERMVHVPLVEVGEGNGH